MTKEDCCFANENKWFRYREAAVIIDDNCVLFAKSENKADDYFYSSEEYENIMKQVKEQLE
ncbi:MAG: hypothetical protein ACERKN_18310 [Velocimicrobium sp.]